MIKDNLLIIVDENGELMKAPNGVFKANSNYTSGITVIAPFSLDTIVNVSFKRRNRIEDDAGLYLIPNGNYKGKDFLDKSNSLYQKVAHYNVFENEILGKPLKYISTFRPEELFASVNFGVRQVPALATNFKGKFGVNKPLPNDPLEGDFYECDTYNYLLNDVLFTLDDYIYFHNGSWHKANYRAVGGTEPFEIVVKGNIRANEEIEADKDLAVLLAGRVATLESETTVLDNNFDNYYQKHETYTRVEIDDKDAAVLQQAKDYTHVINALNEDRLNTLELEKEDKENKRVDLEDANHTTYPTTKAVKDGLDLKVDSNTYNQKVNELESGLDNRYTKDETHDKVYIDDQLNKKLESEDIADSVNNVLYEKETHKLTFERYDNVDIVIDLPIEALIENISLDGNDLVLTYEDGSTTSVPLNTLLVGVVKEVNGKTPNSSGVINLSYNDLDNLPDLFSGDYNDLTNKPSIPSKTSDLTNDSDFAKNADVVPKTRTINGKDLSVDRTLTSQDIDYILSGETIFERLQDTYRKDEVLNIINQLKTALGWSDSDLGELENNDTYTVELDYNFIILEEHLNGEVIPYQIVIDNMENVSYGDNLTLNNGVLTYTGSEKVYLTGYKTDDKTKIDELSNELMAILGLKRDDLAKLNKNDSYTYSKLYDYLLIKEVNSSNSYLLDVNTGEIKSTNPDYRGLELDNSYEKTTLGGKSVYITKIKRDVGDDYKVVPKVRKTYSSLNNIKSVGEFLMENPGRYIAGSNITPFDIGNTNRPNGVVIIDGVEDIIDGRPTSTSRWRLGSNDMGWLKAFEPTIFADTMLAEGYTQVSPIFEPIIINGNKVSGLGTSSAKRQIITQLNNGDYRIFSFEDDISLSDVGNILENRGDVLTAVNADGGGSVQTFLNDELVYAAERNGLGRRVPLAFVWELEEFVAGGIIDLEGNKITYNGDSKLEIVGIQSRPERQYQELKRDFNTFKQEVEGLFTTDYTGIVSGTNNIELPSIVAKAPIRVGFGYEKEEVRNLAVPDLNGKTHLGNGVYRLYNVSNITLDYNVFNGVYTLNGTPTSNVITFGEIFNIAPMNGTFSFLKVAGTSNLGSIYWNGEASNQTLLSGIRNGVDVNNDVVITSNFAFITFSDYSQTTYDNYTFKMQLEKGSQATDYQVPYIEGYSTSPQTNLRFTVDNTSMYIRGDRGLLDGEEVIYSGGRYFIKLNNDYLPMESSGMAISKPNERVLVENAMQEVMLYNNGLEVHEDYKIDELEVLTIINPDGTEVDLNINNATITDTKITHPNISNGDLVYFTYKYQGVFPSVEYEILYYIHDKTYMSPDGSVWVIEKSVSNNGTISETAVKVE